MVKILEKNVEVTDATLIAGIRNLLVPRRSQQQMADLLGISRSVLANYETGRTDVAREHMHLALDLLGLTRSEAEDRVASRLKRDTENAVGTRLESEPLIRLVPYWGEVPCGDWEKSVSDPHDIQISETVQETDVVAVRVRGDSMEPRLRHGQIVVVKLDPTPVSGVITLARNGHKEMTLKVLRMKGGHWYLESINPEYDGAEAEEWEIVGHAIHVEEYSKGGLRP